MFERFTEDARAVLVRAQHEATELRHDEIGPGHVLLGLLIPPGSRVAGLLREAGVGDHDAVRARLAGPDHPSPGRAVPPEQALAAIGIDVQQIRRRAEENFGPGALRFPHPRFSLPAKRLLELVVREAFLVGHFFIGPEHILLGLLAEGAGSVSGLLTGLGVDQVPLRTAVTEAIAPTVRPLREANLDVSRLGARLSGPGELPRDRAAAAAAQLRRATGEAYRRASDALAAVQRELTAELRAAADAAGSALAG